ncbi:transferase family-domain-containing protein [Jackrogersella minutella]|nr:transferase family-domain-containing protein [Jackrogersella minutella]
MANLSSLDELMPRGYVRQMFCFPSTHPEVSHVLKIGLAGVITDVPYLLSGVITSNDLKHISLSEPYQTLKDIYSEQDLSYATDYAIMKEQHFPPSTFTAPGIIPPEIQHPFPNRAPVFRAKLSLVKGGFILCIAVYHCTTDITGFGALLKIWASHCRTGASAAVGFGPAWLDREVLLQRPNISNRPAPTSVPELLHVKGPSEFSRLASLASQSSDLVTGIFFFAQKTLQTLKLAVNEHIASQGLAGWVSSSDILTALLWSAVLAAESESVCDAKGSNTIGFPVNFRSRFAPPLPPDYLGAAFVMTTATASRADLISFSTDLSSPRNESFDSSLIPKLAMLASLIRTSLQRVDEESVRDVLQYLEAASADHPPIMLGPRHDGISIVSWAHQGVYELDWGDIIGKCDAVRLPKLMSKRYPIILPRVSANSTNGDGGFEVIVNFDRQVLKRFEQSWLVRRFAILRCYS